PGACSNPKPGRRSSGAAVSAARHERRGLPSTLARAGALRAERLTGRQRLPEHRVGGGAPARARAHRREERAGRGARPALGSARLIALDASGVTDETVLQAEVPGRHESGGWADLAQSRYERHILEHREQHFAAVAAAIGAWTERYDAHHIVLAAEPRSAAALRKHLPEAVAARIAGVVAGARTRARR